MVSYLHIRRIKSWAFVHVLKKSSRRAHEHVHCVHGSRLFLNILPSDEHTSGDVVLGTSLPELAENLRRKFSRWADDYGAESIFG